MSSLFKKAASGVKGVYKEAYKEVNGVVQQGQQKWAQHQQQQQPQPQPQQPPGQQPQQPQPQSAGQYAGQYGDQYGQYGQQYQVQPAQQPVQQFDPYGQPLPVPQANAPLQQHQQPATPQSPQYYDPGQPQQQFEEYAPPPGPPPSHPSFSQHHDQFSEYEAPPEPPQQHQQQQQIYQSLPSPLAPAPLNIQPVAPQSSPPTIESFQSSAIAPAQPDPLASQIEALTLQQSPVQQPPALEKQLPTSPTLSSELPPSAQPTQSPTTNESIQLSREPIVRPGHECLASVGGVLVESNPPYVLHPQTRAQLGIDELDIGICANCFAAHVAPYPSLTVYFVPYQVPPRDPNSRALLSYVSYFCDLAFPRGLQTIRQCTAQNNIQPLFELPKIMSTFSPCEAVVKPSTEGMWTIKEGNDIGVCHACYELYVRSTSFEREFYFQNGTSTETEAQWICDIAQGGGISRMLTKEVKSPSPDYRRWLSLCQARPVPCPGLGVALAEAGTNVVYAATAPDTGIFCRACYHDHMLGTSLEGAVHELQLPPDQLATTACNMASPFAKFAMKIAGMRGDYKIFTDSLGHQVKVPPCVGLIGVDEADLRAFPQEYHWYKMRSHPNIEICPACYHICIALFGMESLFEPLERPLVDGLARQCFLTHILEDEDNNAVDDLNSYSSTLAWRGKLLRDGITFFSQTHGDSSIFLGYAEMIAPLPAPCFMDSRACMAPNSRRYFGKNKNLEDPEDFYYTVCEECFLNNVKGTALEHMLSLDATAAANAQPTGFICQSHTNRTRRILHEDLARGDWEHFARHWRQRQAVAEKLIAARARYDAQLQKQLAMKAAVDLQGQQIRMNVMQSLNANQNAIISGIGGSVAEAAATDHGQRYGNPSAGYGFLTANGARAAMDQQQAAQYVSQLQVKDVSLYQDSGNTISDSYVIHALFEEIKKEWEAIK